MVQTIPQMHKQLEQLNHFFTTSTTGFIGVINSHPGRFTPSDTEQFRELIEEIRSEAFQKIRQFFESKHTVKCGLYDSRITNYSEEGQNVNDQLMQFRRQLEEGTVALKRQQNRREQLLESFSRKYNEHVIYKRVWKLFQENRDERKFQKQLDRKMDEVYRRNLLKKAFFPWRTLTYKEGFENTVRRETQRDIGSIHEQYQGIIEILKGKIGETDDMIRVKRAAKGEFAFALSKNLLKTISNLSLEVMSLNQMSLRDGECDESQTKKFMKEVDGVIAEKLSKVRQYRQAILGGEENEAEEKKKKKKITFL